MSSYSEIRSARAFRMCHPRLYILCQFFGVLDNILALIIIYALINPSTCRLRCGWPTPIFARFLGAILQAAPHRRGHHLRGTVARAAAGGPSGTFFHGAAVGDSLFERAFCSLNLTSVKAAPLAVFIASHWSPGDCSGRSCRRPRFSRLPRSWCWAG